MGWVGVSSLDRRSSLIVDDLLSYDSGLSCGQSVYSADGSAKKARGETAKALDECVEIHKTTVMNVNEKENQMKADVENESTIV